MTNVVGFDQPATFEVVLLAKPVERSQIGSFVKIFPNENNDAVLPPQINCLPFLCRVHRPFPKETGPTQRDVPDAFFGRVYKQTVQPHFVRLVLAFVNAPLQGDRVLSEKSQQRLEDGFGVCKSIDRVSILRDRTYKNVQQDTCIHETGHVLTCNRT